MKKKMVIVGAGYAGCCLAAMWREQFEVLVLESDATPGGLCKSYYLDGMVYEYGPHILANHNCSPEAIQFIKDHVDSVETGMTSASFVQGQYTYYPVHRRNAQMLGLTQQIEAELAGLPKSPRTDNFETYLIDKVGKTFYEIYFKEFTEKFWGIAPARLSAEWAKIRHLGESLDEEKMFFNKHWCAYPRRDWNELFSNLLKGVKVLYDAAVADVELDRQQVRLRSGVTFSYDLLVSTLSIDSLFAQRFGRLAYRGYDIEPEIVARDYFAEFNGQPVSMSYFPEKKYPYCRITDYKTFQKKEACPEYQGRTLITREVPTSGKEFYPFTDSENLTLLDKYARLAAACPNIVTFGRKGLYKYLTTDTTTEMALRLRKYLLRWESLSTDARYAAYQEIRGGWSN